MFRLTTLALVFLPLAGPARPAAADPPAESTLGGDIAWLEQQTRRLLDGCKLRAHDGTILFTPDGHAHYHALWTRDFAYMVENAGHLMPPAEVDAAIRYLIRGQRADGAVPDRVPADGVAVYTAGDSKHPLGEPNLDNPAFLVIAADEHLKCRPEAEARAMYAAWAAALAHGIEWVPRSPRGLVWNDPAKPHSPYGFTDTVAKTGELLMESLLDWTACRRLAVWEEKSGHTDAAARWRARCRAIEENLGTLWDDRAGAFLAATRDCRQVDIWGNAYAIALGIPLGPRRQRVLAYLHDNLDTYTWRGQVRHLPKGEHWQRMLGAVPPERYQNGAYWATATGWVVEALNVTDPALARRVFRDMVADFRREGICECVNEGYRQLESYVVSAANPLGSARRLFGSLPSR
jgi:hypothetical protein